MRFDEALKRRHVRRVKARYHGRCKCSAGVWPGNEIAWDVQARRVVGCQPCDYTGRPPDDWQSPADWRGIDRDDPDLFGGQP